MRFMIVAVASLTAGSALAQAIPGVTGPTANSPPPVTDTMPSSGSDKGAAGSSAARVDQRFLRDAASANQAQIRLGQLAVDRGSTAKTRQLGQRVLDDHNQIADRLQTIASRLDVVLPGEPTATQKADFERLAILTGKQFDDAYVEMLKSDQQQAIALFQDEARDAVDPELERFAQSALPSLRRHEQLAARAIDKL